MRPIPETIQAVDEFEPYLDEGDLLKELGRTSERVLAIAPEVIGMSVATYERGVTLTLVATGEEIAALDAFQYLSGGPCVEANDPDSGVEATGDDFFDEPRWRLFAEASAARSVRSTLTLPIVQGGEVTGTVNLYGASEHTFRGRYADLAAAVGGLASGAVLNADLSFSTRQLAQQAPGILRESAVLESAVGVIASSLDIGFREARERLHRAAEAAGISPARLAGAVLALRFDR